MLRVSGDSELAERFPRFRRRLARRLPTINQVSRQQVDLLRRFRAASTDQQRQQYLVGAAVVDQLHFERVRGDGVVAVSY